MRFKMSAAYGVHFGCSSACIAVNKDEKTDVIANDAGDRTTPSVVAFTDHDQVVGLAARQGIIRNHQNTVCHVKQILGLRSDDRTVTEYKRNSSVQVTDNKGDPVFEVDYKEARKTFTPSQITTAIFKSISETAQSHGGSGIQDTVITVPMHFTQEQKQALSSAASKAGFNILRMIYEPTAAALAYDVGQNDHTESSKVLVFRLGGLTSDSCVINVQSGMYQVVTSVPDNSLGGDRFTAEIAKVLTEKFKSERKQDLSDNKRAKAKVLRAAEGLKHTLSKLDTARCAIESLYEGIDFDTNLSRARFESCVSELVQRCTQLIDQSLNQGNVSRDSIDKVILCGGGANMPIVQKAISDMFSSAELLNTLSPEEVIAIGAAKQAGILVGLDESDIKLNNSENSIDCISKAICIKVPSEAGPEYHPVFTKSTPLHTRKHVDFDLSEDQTAFMLEVCEMDSKDTGRTVAKIVMRDLPAASKINSTFHLRRDGHLHITCTEQTTNRIESVTIEPS